MAADAAVAHELAALQRELSATRRDRPRPLSAAEPPPIADAGNAEAADQAHEARATGEEAEERDIAEQVRDLVGLVEEFIEEAERNVSEHPAASVIGALFLGIVIGRLIGRR